jgi:hypothetical protein
VRADASWLIAPQACRQQRHCRTQRDTLLRQALTFAGDAAIGAIIVVGTSILIRLAA